MIPGDKLYYGEEWSNSACLGYFITTLVRAGFTHYEIDRLCKVMRNLFDTLSVIEAAESYQNSPY